MIGLVGFLFVLAKISLYGAELNPVLARGLWPRAVRETDPTEADHRALDHRAQQSLRAPDQQVGARSWQADASGVERGPGHPVRPRRRPGGTGTSRFRHERIGPPAGEGRGLGRSHPGVDSAGPTVLAQDPLRRRDCPETNGNHHAHS